MVVQAPARSTSPAPQASAAEPVVDVRAHGTGLGPEELLAEARMVFQPVVDIASGVVVGHEAFLRGPAGSDIELPAGYFQRATEVGCHVELDRHAFSLAVDAVSRSGRWQPENGVFVNAGPAMLFGAVTDDFEAAMRAAAANATCTLEIGVADAYDRPVDVLHTIKRFRERGWRIALTDLGEETTSMSMLALLEPDVVKLAPCTIDAGGALPPERMAAVLSMLHERTGAPTVAQGVESSLQSGRAWELGVQLGQGWWFGYPREVSEVVHGGPLVLPAAAAPTTMSGLLDEWGDDWPEIDTETATVLVGRLLDEALGIADEATVVVQVGDLPGGAASLQCPLAAIAGAGAHLTVAATSVLGLAPVGAYVVDVGRDDPNAGLTVVAVLGADSALGLVLRPGPGPGPGPGRRGHVLTDDVGAVAAVARAVMLR